MSVPRVKLVVFIIDWNKIKATGPILEKAQARFQYSCKGKGTASSDILDLLGIGSGDKAVMFCLEEENAAPALMQELGKKLGFDHPGTGIAFTVPLAAINAPALKVFADRAISKAGGEIRGGQIEGGQDSQSEEDGGEGVSGEIKFELIVSILNQGFSDEFMAAAKEAGAGGGTVISARGTAHKGPVKFFGISLQEEKEVIIILSTREKKMPIMQAVSKFFGITSKADGVVFSLPVDSVTGIDLK
jgi:nitrogen regulatory protein PII